MKTRTPDAATKVTTLAAILARDPSSRLEFPQRIAEHAHRMVTLADRVRGNGRGAKGAAHKLEALARGYSVEVIRNVDGTVGLRFLNGTFTNEDHFADRRWRKVFRVA